MRAYARCESGFRTKFQVFMCGEHSLIKGAFYWKRSKALSTNHTIVRAANRAHGRKALKNERQLNLVSYFIAKRAAQDALWQTCHIIRYKKDN